MLDLHDRKDDVKRNRNEPLKRANFAETWDTLAGQDDEEQARIAIAGYADEEQFRLTALATKQMLFDCVDIKQHDTVLEIGCGIGRAGEVIAPLCKKWIGADVSKNMLKHLERRLSRFKNVEAVLLSGWDLDPIQSNSIDLIYCTVVFMHLSEWDRFKYVEEGLRVLKPGGRMLVDNFSLTSDEGWKVFIEHTKIPPLERPLHIGQSSTPQELEVYFRRAGFANIQQKDANPWIITWGQKP